jgi:hypothetical protein
LVSNETVMTPITYGAARGMFVIPFFEKSGYIIYFYYVPLKNYVIFSLARSLLGIKVENGVTS